MNNLFKNNSRFAVLIEDNPQQQKKDKPILKKSSEIKIVNKEERFNAFKNETYNNNLISFNRIDRDSRYRRHNEIESHEAKKERLSEDTLNIINFPSLVNIDNKTNIDKLPKINYIEKIKNTENNCNEVIKNDIQDPDIALLKAGWVMLKRDPKTGKTIIKSPIYTTFPEKSKTEKSELEIGKDILKALTELHEKRSKEYIDNYGEYTWEKMFKSPRWYEEETEYITDSDDDYDEDIDYEDEYEEDEYGY